ncbi:Ribonuclease H1 [Cytospora mali]|uniref:ribonuclease H n=1 Tax=Cytospora mali TaxID=578113 RepID=A0A194VW23_CYTMA|nr:Ribonuclease H1 [Valsa mali]
MEKNEKYMSPEMPRGTGRVIPTKFTLPSPTSTPDSVFQGRATYARVTRFVHRQDRKKGLIFTDGACINNGRLDPKAGWAFVHGPRGSGDQGNEPARICASRLENKGPYGDAGAQTSNRAEMRAVIAALGYRNWHDEGFNTMVIATDSEYVVEGATGWVRGWVRNGWKTRNGNAVKNKDLWETLLGQAEELHDRGMDIQFWRIPRGLNHIADAAAKKAAEGDEVDHFVDFVGFVV